MDIKNELNNCKSNIKYYKKVLKLCTDTEKQNHLKYQIEQEQIKLESFELLLSLSEKVRGKYE